MEEPESDGRGTGDMIKRGKVDVGMVWLTTVCNRFVQICSSLVEQIF